jgi:hypothetical protein
MHTRRGKFRSLFLVSALAVVAILLGTDAITQKIAPPAVGKSARGHTPPGGEGGPPGPMKNQ